MLSEATVIPAIIPLQQKHCKTKYKMQHITPPNPLKSRIHNQRERIATVAVRFSGIGAKMSPDQMYAAPIRSVHTHSTRTRYYPEYWCWSPASLNYECDWVQFRTPHRRHGDSLEFFGVSEEGSRLSPVCRFYRFLREFLAAEADGQTEVLVV